MTVQLDPSRSGRSPRDTDRTGGSGLLPPNAKLSGPPPWAAPLQWLVRPRYREGQEDQLGALGLVVNAVVLWNTRYLDAALSQVRASDVSAKPEDVERLSPLLLDHVNVLGRYEFALKESVRQGQLRPLRIPDERDDRAA